MPNTHLILHVKGTEQETTTLPKQVVRAAISQGQITHSQLIWSPEENAWKQVRDLPHLLPSQQLAPAPPPRLGTGALPKIDASQPRIGTGALPKIEGVPQPRIATGTLPKIGTGALPKIQGAPQVAVRASAQTPKMKVAAAKPAVAPGHSDGDEHHDFHPVKWICIVLSVVILGAVGFNYFMIDQPLMADLNKTSYRSFTVYAHLGAFVQPNVLLIHIWAPSSQLTEANLTDFLSTVARSTPRSPVNDVLFDRVALTPGWTGIYAFSGSDWKQLGEMQKADEADRKLFILEKLTDTSGQPLVSHSSLNGEAQEAERDKVWTAFVGAFTGK